MTFEGIVGYSYTGDLAIDDVSISSGNCKGHTASPTFSTTPIFSPSVTSDQSSPPSSQTPLVSTSCNFDSGLCDGWEQSYSDVFDWTLHFGSTWSSDTGPNYDHTSGIGEKES